MSEKRSGFKPNYKASSIVRFEGSKNSTASSGPQSILRNRGTKHISQKDWEEQRKKNSILGVHNPTHLNIVAQNVSLEFFYLLKMKK